MNLIKNKKAISISLFLIFITSGVLLFIQLHDLVLSGTDETAGYGPVYFLFTAQLILGIGLFMTGSFRKEKTVEYIETELNNNFEEKKESTSENNTSVQEDILQDEELEEIIKSVLPEDELLKDPEKYGEKLVSNFSATFEIVQGVVFVYEDKQEEYHPIAKYAYFNDEPPQSFKTGETLPGQVARNKNMLIVDEIPEGYIKVVSGLGTSSPKHLLIFPVLNDDKVIGIIELASFKVFDKKTQTIITKLSERLNAPFSSLIKEQAEYES